MKKLYKIIVTHYAPKGSHTSIQEYVVAENDRSVFDYLANGYAYWKDIVSYCCDEDDLKRCMETYKEILDNKGDYREVDDLYYGATQYSWEEVDLEPRSCCTQDVIIAMLENNLAKMLIDGKVFVNHEYRVD